MAMPTTGTLVRRTGLTCCLVLAALAAAPLDGEPAPSEAAPLSPPPLPAGAGPIVCLEQLTCLSWPELECLYRQAPPGAIPTGYTRGKVIHSPCERRAGAKNRLNDAVWHGKDFDCLSSTLVNQWCGFQAVHARVCHGRSWLDGRPSIIMDYCGMSRVIWSDVRDEVREVAPGIYLGLMYRRRPCGPEMKLFFALQCCPRQERAHTIP